MLTKIPQREDKHCSNAGEIECILITNIFQRQTSYWGIYNNTSETPRVRPVLFFFYTNFFSEVSNVTKDNYYKNWATNLKVTRDINFYDFFYHYNNILLYIIIYVLIYFKYMSCWLFTLTDWHRVPLLESGPKKSTVACVHSYHFRKRVLDAVIDTK